MNQSKSAGRSSLHPTLAELQQHEHDAHRLRAEYAHDLGVNLVVGADLLVRRAAHRILKALQGSGHGPAPAAN